MSIDWSDETLQAFQAEWNRRLHKIVSAESRWAALAGWAARQAVLEEAAAALEPARPKLSEAQRAAKERRNRAMSIVLAGRKLRRTDDEISAHLARAGLAWQDILSPAEKALTENSRR